MKYHVSTNAATAIGGAGAGGDGTAYQPGSTLPPFPTDVPGTVLGIQTRFCSSAVLLGFTMLHGLKPAIRDVISVVAEFMVSIARVEAWSRVRFNGMPSCFSSPLAF
jgi:hypothetical protein